MINLWLNKSHKRQRVTKISKRKTLYIVYCGLYIIDEPSQGGSVATTYFFQVTYDSHYWTHEVQVLWNSFHKFARLSVLFGVFLRTCPSELRILIWLTDWKSYFEVFELKRLKMGPKRGFSSPTKTRFFKSYQKWSRRIFLIFCAKLE